MKSYVVNVKDGRLIASVPDKKTANMAGQTVQQIADAQGKHVVDALLDMVVEEDLATEFLAETQGRETAKFTTEVLNSNVVVAGVSDGGAHVKFLTAGIYPTDMLTWLVRDQKAITLGGCAFQAELSAGPCWRLQRPWRHTGTRSGGYRGV